MTMEIAALSRPFSAIAVANSLIEIANARAAGVDTMKLQKLLYYTHGWNLALRGVPLLDEEVQAWKYGPVVVSVYQEFKKFGASRITSLGEEADFDVEEGSVTFSEPLVQGDKYGAQLLSVVWECYGEYNAIELSKMTHSVGTAWHRVWSGNKYNLRYLAIPNHLIREEFDTLFREDSHLRQRFEHLRYC